MHNLAIIGVGLIGGSLALALKESNFVKEVIGFGRNQQNLDLALELGVIDAHTKSITEAVHGADIIVIATPVQSVANVLVEIAPIVSSQAVITDVGSVKGSVITDIENKLGKLPANFIPGHPIAGTEKSGAGAAFATLYHNHKVILTPLADNDPVAVNKVSEMWQQAGAEVVKMDVAEHDRILAATSHLPHLLAFGLVDTLARSKDQKRIFEFAAGGFRDFTRIASSNPTMWRDICLTNGDAIKQHLNSFRAELDEIESAITSQDADALYELFNRAKITRDKFS